MPIPVTSPIIGLPQEVGQNVVKSELISYQLPPTRVVWQSDVGVSNGDALLGPKWGQTLLTEQRFCTLTGSGDQSASILIDFGTELHGYVEIFTPATQETKPRRIRVRFGESVMEAMSELHGANRAQTDHAMRDQFVNLPWLGKQTVGPSGFRFVRIDSVVPGQMVEISEIRAVLVIRDIPAIGSFSSSDERLNRIWAVGAYTVLLNMQDYLWDGIKRDRLVWVGDMHPEMSTINAVFGYNNVVPKSLDLSRDTHPPGEWMNGVSSYSMWWVIMHRDWWLHHGHLDYLQTQQRYLTDILDTLISLVGVDGAEQLTGIRFVDWPTARNEAAVHEGLQALMILAMEAGGELQTVLGDTDSANRCRSAATKLRQHSPGVGSSKQSAALMLLSGLIDRNVALPILERNGPRELSTFYGYYVLQALAHADAHDVALDFISEYWGSMLDYGATTFWEDFNLEWIENAGRIDELTPPGKADLHGDFGDHCYRGFRHSLCHGWASGPTAWLSSYVLGVQPVEPGFSKVKIAPHLGGLEWVEGSYPTPHGPIKVRHDRKSDGGIETKIEVPPGIQVLPA